MSLDEALAARIRAADPNDANAACSILVDLKERLSTDPKVTMSNAAVMADNEADDLLAFLHYAHTIKETRRTGWYRGDVQGPKETVACHMYRLALMAAVLAPRHSSAELDAGRCVRMALVHDLAEAIVGDITPECGVDPAEKHRMEAEAMAKICQTLPSPDVLTLWNEYDTHATPESRFVHDLDKLEFAMQASEYAHREPELADKPLSVFVSNGLSRVSDPFLQPLADAVRRHLSAARSNAQR